MKGKQTYDLFSTQADQSPVDFYNQLTILHPTHYTGEFYGPNGPVPTGNDAVIMGFHTSPDVNSRTTWSMSTVNGPHDVQIDNVYCIPLGIISTVKAECSNAAVCAAWSDATYLDLSAQHHNKDQLPVNRILMFNIQDQSTLAIAEWAVTGSLPAQGHLVKAPDYTRRAQFTPYESRSDRYYALLGTPIGQMVARLLYRHRPKITGQIYSIEVFSDYSPNQHLTVAFTVQKITEQLPAAQTSFTNDARLNAPVLSSESPSTTLQSLHTMGSTAWRRLLSTPAQIDADMMSENNAAPYQVNWQQVCVGLLGNQGNWQRRNPILGTGVYGPDGPIPMGNILTKNLHYTNDSAANRVVAWASDATLTAQAGRQLGLKNVYNIQDHAIFSTQTEGEYSSGDWAALAWCDFVALGGRPELTRSIFQLGIDDPDTLAVIQYTQNGAPFRQGNTLLYPDWNKRWTYTPDGVRSEQFKLLLGMPTGRGFASLLYTHKMAFRNHVITRIEIVRESTGKYRGSGMVPKPVMRFTVGEYKGLRP